MSLPYRDFYYPLNVFMHILTHEEGDVPYLHYGLFEREDEPIGRAQEHSTELLMERLPRPPASLLEVGIGVGTTLARLTALGYEAEGITPDEKQIALARRRHAGLRIQSAAFESFSPGRTYDCVIFQESAQYIDAAALFSKARELTGEVIVLDEFALQPVGGLPLLETFLSSAAANDFRNIEEVDLSSRAIPTIDYFLARIPRYRERLIDDLGLTPAQVDELMVSGERYRRMYREGVYGYRLLSFRAA